MAVTINVTSTPPLVIRQRGLRGLQGVPGATGPAGPQGVKGDRGEEGPTGPAGTKGDTGATGAKGSTGSVGSTGPKGDKGDTGSQGVQGNQGVQGEDGLQGDAGPEGAAAPELQIEYSVDGTGGWMSTWNSTHYYLRTSADAGATWSNAVLFVGDTTKTPIRDVATSYQLLLADAGRLVRVTSGTPRSVTVPPNALVAFPVESVISIEQGGAGNVNILAGSGVTINSYLGAKTLVGQHAVAGLIKTDTDEWTLYGNISNP